MFRTEYGKLVAFERDLAQFMVRGGAVSIALVILSYHVAGYGPRLVCEWCNRVDGSPVTMYRVKNELWHLFINIYH